MTDSSSFSSLLALVDSHLSKTTLQESRSDDGNNVSNRIPIPNLTGNDTGTLSETRLSFSPGQRLPIPTFNLSGESPIQSILAEQVSNMLKAKEQKRQEEEERQRLADEMKKIKLEEDDNVIDLMQALQVPTRPREVVSAASVSSSLESLFEPNFIDCEGIQETTKNAEPLLPCKTDMSYIIHQKIRKGKCSAFGKVLTSRLRPVATPYLREIVDSRIVKFDFKTKSPCDIIKENLRKPTMSASCVPIIFI